MTFYEHASAVILFKNSRLLPFDQCDLHAKQGKNFLEVEYNGCTYTLGLTPDGLLNGFDGAITPDKTADLVILHRGPFDWVFHERKHQSETDLEFLYSEPKEKAPARDIEAFVAAFMGIAAPLSGRAY